MGPERIPFFYCRSLKIFQISNKLLKIPNRPSRKRQNTKKTKIKKSIPIPPVRRFLVFPSSRTFFLIRVFYVSALRTPGDAVSPYRAETHASFTAAPAAAANHPVRLSLSRTVPSASLFYIIDLFSRFERGQSSDRVFFAPLSNFFKIEASQAAERRSQSAGRKSLTSAGCRLLDAGG